MSESTPVNSRFLDATQYSVAWFWARLKNEELNAQPPYQRNPVWQLRQRQYLLDSILNGYPVPEIYLQTITSSDGSERHTIVDGQQRIRACMEFVSGDFALAEEGSTYAGCRFDDLPPAARQMVFGYKFVIRLLPVLPEAEIRDIFARLNRNNVVLNQQELRHATYWGEFMQSMEAISNNPFWQSSRLFTAMDIRRMRDVEYVSELVVTHLFGLQNKRGRIDRTYADFEDEYPERVAVESRVGETLELLGECLSWPSKTRWSRKVDFYTLFGVIVDEMETNPVGCGEAVRGSVESLDTFASEVTRILRMDDTEIVSEEKMTTAAVRYARGVRNSSDLGSRRLRRDALRAILFDEQLPDAPEGPENGGILNALDYEVGEPVDSAEPDEPEELD